MYSGSPASFVLSPQSYISSAQLLMLQLLPGSRHLVYLPPSLSARAAKCQLASTAKCASVLPQLHFPCNSHSPLHSFHPSHPSCLHLYIYSLPLRYNSLYIYTTSDTPIHTYYRLHYLFTLPLHTVLFIFPNMCSSSTF